MSGSKIEMRESYRVLGTKDDLKTWVQDALHNNGGRATLIEVAKHIWANREIELRTSGDLFYHWQYDMRWAATELRGAGIMIPADTAQDGMWQLSTVTV